MLNSVMRHVFVRPPVVHRLLNHATTDTHAGTSQRLRIAKLLTAS
jgi:hypothetical protein